MTRVTTSPAPVRASSVPPAPQAPTSPKSPAKQTVQDWFDDRYMKVEVSTVDGKTVPTRISLKDGDATVKRLKGTEVPQYEITYQGKRYLAVAVPGSGGAFQFYEKRPTGTVRPGDKFFADGAYRPIQNGDPFAPAARAFQEAVALANGSTDAKLSPTDLAKKKAAEATAAIVPTRRAANELSTQLDTQRSAVEKAAKQLNQVVAPLAPLIEKGLVTVGQDQDGLTEVKLHRPPGVSDGEWTKLENRFGPLVQMAQMDIQKAEGTLRATAGSREQNALALYDKLNSPGMQKYLESLPQPQRLQEFNKYASMLQGTKAGDQLAKDLFGQNGRRTDIEPKGALKVSTDLGRTVFKGVYDSDKSRAALQGLTLALAPNIKDELTGGALPFARRERIAEITLNRPLTAPEKKALDVVANGGPQAMAELLTEKGATEHGVPIGVTSELLAKLGGMPNAVLHGASEAHAVHAAVAGTLTAERAGFGKAFAEKVAPLGKAVMAGATFLSAVDATASVAHFIQHPGLGTGAHAAEGVVRTLHVTGEMMEAFGAHNWLTKYAKATGVVAGSIALVVDIAKEANSPEAKESKVMNIIGDIAIIGGTIAGGPLGLALGAIGAGYKLLSPGPSEAYDKAYDELQKALKKADA